MASNTNTINTKKAGKADTIKQTIVETIEAPRLTDISTASFVMFKQKREIHKRIIAEKNAYDNVEIPLTTYRNSIPNPILQLFVLADWVPVAKLDDITEGHLKACVAEHARINPADYDLARIERELREVKLERAVDDNGLRSQVWRLCLKYMTTLEKCGYDEFVDKQPKLAIHHILKRIAHGGLKKRMLLTLKLRKKELEKDFALFVRELAKEADVFDRHEVASRCTIYPLDSDDDNIHAIDEGMGKRSRKRGVRKNKDKDTSGTALTDRAVRGGKSGDDKRKRDRELPNCLNPRCKKLHFINDCDLSSAEEKAEFKKKYHEAKRQKQADEKKKGIQPRGRVGRIGGSDSKNVASTTGENTSLFSATFCNGAVETNVLADSGSDVTVIPPALLDEIRAADPKVKISELPESITFGNPSTGAPPITCRRMIQMDAELRIGHGEKLILRNAKWLVSDNPLSNAYIGRHLLSALGINNRVLLAAARDRLGGIVNVPDMLQKAGYTDHPCAFAEGSIQSILRERGLDWGSTFHSHGGAEDDTLEDSDVYIDLGEDTPEELDEALDNIISNAKSNGLSEAGVIHLKDLLHRFRKVFRIRLGKSPPAKIAPMKIRTEPGRRPVKVKARKYSAEQRKFLEKYVGTLKDMDFFIDMPTAEWQAAPLLVPKKNSKAKFRMTVDTRPVNAATIVEAWPMPHMEAETNDFQGSRCFASLDFVSGYWQLPLDPESWGKCGVVTPSGVAASTRVLPELSNAVAHFQGNVEPCFAELRDNMKAWLDDFSLHAPDETTLLQKLERFLEICDEKNLFLSARKCVLFATVLRWCGRRISADGYTIDPARLSGLKDMALPKTADELAEFIYCVRWMSVTIPEFGKRISPLGDVLEEAYKKSGKRTKRSIKNIALQSLSWGPDQERTFVDLQDSLRNAVKMSYCDPEKVPCVFTDASNRFWSGVITQTTAEDLLKPLAEQRHEPLAFLGSEFKGAQLHWTTFEKEAFAIYQTFERMDYLLLGQKRTHIFTDHRNLLFIFAPLALEPALGRHVVSKVQRWALYLSRFSYAMEHISGRANVFADLLTRWARGYRSERQYLRVQSMLLQDAEQVIPLPTELVWPDLDTFRSAQRTAHASRPQQLVIDEGDDLWKQEGRIWIPDSNPEFQLKVLAALRNHRASWTGRDSKRRRRIVLVARHA